jgi:hypothetical protein
MHPRLTLIDPLLEAKRSIAPLPREDINVASPVLVTLSSDNSVQPLNTSSFHPSIPSDTGSTLAAAEYLILQIFADLQPFKDSKAILEGLDTNNLEFTEP